MQKHQISNAGQALAYITDCTLATVCEMATKKSRPKHEFERQMSIAQTAIDWMVQIGVDVTTTRVEDVLKDGNVKVWAAKYMPNDESERGEKCLNHKR